MEKPQIKNGARVFIEPPAGKRALIEPVVGKRVFCEPPMGRYSWKGARRSWLRRCIMRGWAQNVRTVTGTPLNLHIEKNKFCIEFLVVITNAFHYI
ncbi:hypothetical protein HMPREF9069_01735 [Atopobium sp. oral taxon 810 str. F0209]|nr:hypothetical protein HMPREF9069_01735 [Atopobium sp. oral taxon 810 str. F0209]